MGQRERVFAVTNSHVLVYVSYWISFSFFSSSFDLHMQFSLLTDTYDISLLKLTKRSSYCSVIPYCLLKK